MRTIVTTHSARSEMYVGAPVDKWRVGMIAEVYEQFSTSMTSAYHNEDLFPRKLMKSVK